MPTKQELEAEVEQLKAELAAQTPPDVAALQAELDQLKADIGKYEGTLVCAGDHVFLDGVKHDIILRDTVKGLVYDGYHKRNVEEDATAVVIRKTGG